MKMVKIHTFISFCMYCARFLGLQRARMGEARSAEGEAHDRNAHVRQILHVSRQGQIRHRRASVRRRSRG